MLGAGDADPLEQALSLYASYIAREVQAENFEVVPRIESPVELDMDGFSLWVSISK